MTKIAISSKGPDLDARVEPCLGRARGFVVVDPQTMAYDFVANGASRSLTCGAGINAAGIVSGTGAGVLLTGNVGPNAFQTLKAAGIVIGKHLGRETVRGAVRRFQLGHVPLAEAPDRRRRRR